MRQIANIGMPNMMDYFQHRAEKKVSVKLTSGIANATLRSLGFDESTSSTAAIGIGTLSGIYLGLNIFDSCFSACVGERISRNLMISLPAESGPFKVS
jgi:hypothetical protein